jgi:hypothetical protein
MFKRHLHPHIHCNITIAKWKCPSMDEWIKKMWYMYTVEYYSAIKEGNPIICDDMDEPGRHYIT